VDPIVEFLKTAAEREKDSPGGFLNFVAMGLFALSIAATGSKWVIGQTFEFLFSLADLLRYGFDRLAATIAAIFGVSVEPVKPFKRYEIPDLPQPRLAYVIVIGVLFIACPLALAAVPHHEGQKQSDSKAPSRH
jgi:hypothetical protein